MTFQCLCCNWVISTGKHAGLPDELTQLVHFSPHSVTALLVLQLLNLVGLLGQGTFLHAQQSISSILS